MQSMWAFRHRETWVLLGQGCALVALATLALILVGAGLVWVYVAAFVLGGITTVRMTWSAIEKLDRRRAAERSATRTSA